MPIVSKKRRVFPQKLNRSDYLVWITAACIALVATIWKTTSFDVRGRAASVPVKAFPQAQGFGTDTPGGRRGKIIEVTNLSDSGAGSFRDAVEVQSGPRIVVFRVSGHIVLNSPVKAKSPFLTIAAQTAPGDGVLLRKDGLIIATHDVIVRNLRVRVGDEGSATNNRDGINISTTYANSDVYNIVLDHCSVSWGIDENVSTWKSGNYTVRDVTISQSIISEGLYDSIHIDEGATSAAPHSMGLLYGPSGVGNLTLHNTLFAHNGGRNPRLDGVDQVEVVNNVFYNWSDIPTQISSSELKAHIINNYYKGGVNSSERDIKFSDNQHQLSKLFIEGNYADFPRARSLDASKTRSPSTDQHSVVLQQDSGVSSKWYTDTPPYFKSATTLFESEVQTVSPQVAYTSVLAKAGAVPRDSVDTRIVQMVTNRAGSRIDSQNQVGGWPVFPPVTPVTDSDHDGMPDEWELGRGLNPQDPADRNATACTGYTQVEEYINSLIPVPFPSLVVPCSGSTVVATATPTTSPMITVTPTQKPTMSMTPTKTPTPTPTMRPSQTPTPTPSIVVTRMGDFEGEYFNNKSLTGSPVLVQHTDAIQFYWGQNSPGFGVNTDQFSVRWTKAETFEGGIYKFTVRADDGLRIYIDGNRVYSDWREHSASTKTFSTQISEGTHTIRVEYFDNKRNAEAKVSWNKL